MPAAAGRAGGRPRPAVHAARDPTAGRGGPRLRSCRRPAGIPSEPVPGPTATAVAVTGPVMTAVQLGRGRPGCSALRHGALGRGADAQPPVAAATHRHVQLGPAPARPAPPPGRAGSRIGSAFVGDHPRGHVDDHPAAVQPGDRTRDHQVNLAAAAAAPPEHLIGGRGVFGCGVDVAAQRVAAPLRTVLVPAQIVGGELGSKPAGVLLADRAQSARRDAQHRGWPGPEVRTRSVAGRRRLGFWCRPLPAGVGARFGCHRGCRGHGPGPGRPGPHPARGLAAGQVSPAGTGSRPRPGSAARRSANGGGSATADSSPARSPAAASGGRPAAAGGSGGPPGAVRLSSRSVGTVAGRGSGSYAQGGSTAATRCSHDPLTLAGPQQWWSGGRRIRA